MSNHKKAMKNKSYLKDIAKLPLLHSARDTSYIAHETINIAPKKRYIAKHSSAIYEKSQKISYVKAILS